MPVFELRVLLPQGEDVVSVSVSPQDEETISLDFPLALGREEAPIGVVPRAADGAAADAASALGVPGAAPAALVPPEPAFDQTRAFPSTRGAHVYTGCYRGYGIAFVNIYPVVYSAAEGVLRYAPRLEVTVETAPSAPMLEKSLATLREGRPAGAGIRAGIGAESGAPELTGLVHDTAMEATYIVSPHLRMEAGLADPDECYPYVIITNSDLAPVFEVLRQHRDSRGLRAKIVLVSDIAAAYSGVDLQDQIRAFIRAAYLNWETEYVLLAGDDDIIPHRGLYATGPSAADADIASDLYYGALDGTWNDDNDSYWGEPLEADLIPEVCVGRAAVGDATQAANFVNKVIAYEASPVVGQVETAQMLGEALSAGTWGGDYKDEVRSGAATHGYTTTGLPGTFTVGTLYDRDLPEAWDKDDLIPLLNAGCHLVNHIGHSNVTFGLRMNPGDVDSSITNDGVTSAYFLLYSQGCYAGSFDNRSPAGYTDDCIGEHFIFAEHAAVAFVGNTRYGWYMPYSTNGSSQHYDRQFFDALFGEGKAAIGDANDDSRIDNINLIDVSAMRWVYYDLVLLGDPAMNVWTASPDSLAVAHPGIIFASDNEVEVTVTGGAVPLAGARVSIFTDSTYSAAATDAGGRVYLDPRALAPGQVHIAVAAPNFYAYLDSITVQPADCPLLNVSEFAVDDDPLGASSGDSDGVAEAGETIESPISIANAGGDSAFAVSAVLRTLDAFITVLDSTCSYGDIAPDSVAGPSRACSYGISPWAPDGHQALFEVEITGSDSTFLRHHTLSLRAAVVSVAGISREDSLYGNGDGCVEPGEGLELTLTLANLGSGEARGVGLTIAEGDPYVSITSDSAFVDSIEAYGEVETASPFVVYVSEDCPEFHRIDIALTITLANGWSGVESLAVYLGGSLADDIETGAPGWTHAGFNDTRVDQWHLETYRNHTSGGMQAWKFGGAGSAAYSSFGHGALLTPQLCLGPNARLTFWHWIHAELNVNRYAWDGGIVEISADGGETWSQISPVGGYYYKIYTNAFSPFAAETPCFAWTGDWTYVEFDLSAYQGPVTIRFRFGSDQYYGDEGWYIDDVAVSDDYASVDIPDGDLTPAPTAFALAEVNPNPVVSKFDVAFEVPRTSRVAVRVFDVAGRAVATIADSVFEPGRHSRAFDAAAALAPGVYFLNLDAPGFSATRKLVVLQ